MSTHRITNTTKIPFPCWVHEVTYQPEWWWCSTREQYQQEVSCESIFTHYSDNGPDQRPEDVPSDKSDATPDSVSHSGHSDLARLSEAAAKESCVALCFDSPYVLHKLSAIITRHFEPMARKVEELRSKEVAYQKAVANYDEWVKRRTETVDALRAENERLRAELDALRTLWTEMRVVLAQSRDANCLCSYGATQVNAVQAANAILNKMPTDIATELTALRADKERLDWLEALVWNQANAIELFEGDNGAIVLGHPDWEQSAESIRSVLDAARNATGQGGRTQ
jgi:hypothetical protein